MTAGNLNPFRTFVEGVLQNPWKFLAVFMLTFFVTLSFFVAIDFTPEATPHTDPSARGSDARDIETPQQGAYVEPSFIRIPAIGVSSAVVNPESRDVAVLDEALKSGVVRYPGSGTLEEDRPMFLFGHSSYLPIVHNQAYRAFNKLGTLTVGDEVRIRSGNREYLYRVSDVRLDRASEVRVDLVGSKKLVMVTCDSFGKVDDRYIVEAEFIASYPL